MFSFIFTAIAVAWSELAANAPDTSCVAEYAGVTTAALTSKAVAVQSLPLILISAVAMSEVPIAPILAVVRVLDEVDPVFPIPRDETSVFWRAISKESDSLIPICIVTLALEPFRRLVPLKFVFAEIESISPASWFISLWIWDLSDAFNVLFPAWTDNSRILCKIFSTSPSAPSAVCVNEIASFAFLIATPKLLTCDSILDAIAEPAASSLAELILKPEDILAIALSNSFVLSIIFFWATIAPIFVFIEVITFSPNCLHNCPYGLHSNIYDS